MKSPAITATTFLPTSKSSGSRHNNNSKSLEESIPSPAVVTTVTSDSSSISDESHCYPQHDNSLRQQNTSFSFDDLSKFPRELARKIDWINRCNNPFEVFRSLGIHPRGEKQQLQHSAVLDGDDYEQQFFGLERERNDGELDNNINPYVAFQILPQCEYCGGASTDTCNPHTCSRPSTFFPKQQPPFCQPDSKKWKDDDTMRIQRLQELQRQRRKRPPIRSMEDWKIVSTPKAKNQWRVTPLAPTVVQEGKLSPRLLFPNLVNDDEINMRPTSRSSLRSVVSTNSSHLQHPSFFPVSTRELHRQRPTQSLPATVLLAEFQN
jgi:hypothetical protein